MIGRFFLLTILVVALSVSPVFSDGIVDTEPYLHIRSDGRVILIHEGDTTLVQRNGSIYTLTASICSDRYIQAIFVEKDNIVIDGAGFSLQGTGVYRSEGIDLTGRSNVTVKNMRIEGFGYGIYLENSSNNTINENNISNNTDNTYEMQSGIILFDSSNNTISKNNITRNDTTGMYLVGSSNNTISENNIINNRGMGLFLWLSSGNIIHGNSVANHGGGMSLYGSSGNIIYHNSFINNTNQVGIWLGPTSVNVWSSNNEGNYWSDYLTKYPNATQVDDIWNTPYIVNNVYGETDEYPLVVPYVVEEFPSLLLLTLFMIATLLAAIVYRRKQRPSKHDSSTFRFSYGS